jgi:dTDP-4-dehydrorhamnose reductase
MKEKILITGPLGLVGSRFIELFPRNESLIPADLPEFDLTSSENVSSFIAAVCPQVIIHFAAYTDVGAAERQRNNKSETCWQINVEGTGRLLSAAEITKSRLIHISTDMVFSGRDDDPGPYTEKHPPETDSAKLTWYGYSKAVGEQMVADAGGTIARIIYPVRASFSGKSDYLRKPLKLFDQGQLYPLFTDQQVSVSYIDEVCLALQKIINQDLSGVFHFSTPDTASPYELVSYLITKARDKTDVVKPASLVEFLKQADNPVRYPRFGGLQVRDTEKRLKMKFSTWKEVIDKLVGQGITV